MRSGTREHSDRRRHRPWLPRGRGTRLLLTVGLVAQGLLGIVGASVLFAVDLRARLVTPMATEPVGTPEDLLLPTLWLGLVLGVVPLTLAVTAWTRPRRPPTRGGLLLQRWWSRLALFVGVAALVTVVVEVVDAGGARPFHAVELALGAAIVVLAARSGRSRTAPRGG